LTAIHAVKRTEKESAPGADHFQLSQFEKDGKMARMSLIFFAEFIPETKHSDENSHYYTCHYDPIIKSGFNSF
jgi:hypothetical protein